jgi:multiple sugar transport system substrate-binding protein
MYAKIRFLIVVCLVVVVVATAFPQSSLQVKPAQAEDEVTLKVWGFVWTADWLDAVAPAFEEAHPGVNVEVERFEYEAYRDAIVTALASGEDVPNVVTLDPMWAGDLIREGALMSLDGIEETLNPADFVAGGWELCGYAGKQYGVPADLDFNILFYRKDIYDPAIAEAGLEGFPTNAEDFIKVAEAITNDDQAALLLENSDYYNWYQTFLTPYNGRLTNDEGTKYTFNSDAGVEALQLYSDLINEHGVALGWDTLSDGDPNTAIKEGSALAIAHGSWYATELESFAPEMKGMWGVAPMPFGPSDRQYHAATGGACFSIPGRAENTDIATEFLIYLEQPEVMATYFELVGGLPALKTAWDHIDLTAMNEYLGVPLGQLVADWSEGVRAMELPSSEVIDLLNESIYQVTVEEVDAEEALDAAVDASPSLD